MAWNLPTCTCTLEEDRSAKSSSGNTNPTSDRLERKIAHLLKRPVGRPSYKTKKFYASFRYRAGSWDQARRVVAKVDWHAGELFRRVGFIVTNLKWPMKRVVRFYTGPQAGPVLEARGRGQSGPWPFLFAAGSGSLYTAP